MYKIELHLHTKYASGCGKMDAEEIARAYADAGYSGIVVTDHYNRNTVWYPQMLPPGNDLHGFLEGYYRVKKAGESLGLKVYRGAEIRFDESPNDYLLYNYPDELLTDPDALFSMGLEKFIHLSRRAGAVLIQAHPCRTSSAAACHPAKAELLDGVEIRNLCIGNTNHNGEALAFARANPQLIRTQGSDCHRPEGVALAGIACSFLPEDDAALAEMLRNRVFSLIEPT